jgi:L-fucose isomerase-like protein
VTIEDPSEHRRSDRRPDKHQTHTAVFLGCLGENPEHAHHRAYVNGAVRHARRRHTHTIAASTSAKASTEDSSPKAASLTFFVTSFRNPGSTTADSVAQALNFRWIVVHGENGMALARQ